MNNKLNENGVNPLGASYQQGRYQSQVSSSNRRLSKVMRATQAGTIAPILSVPRLNSMSRLSR